MEYFKGIKNTFKLTILYPAKHIFSWHTKAKGILSAVYTSTDMKLLPDGKVE